MTTVTGTSSSSSSTAPLATSTSQETSDRFLKLLVAQMQNQDPLNPMDNAQVTSQMAQINTVQGISTLNESVQSLSTQFVQMQALQGAALVGKGVLVEGKQLAVQDGSAAAGFELAGPADAVRIDVVNAAGKVVDSIDAGAESSGQHFFTWTPPASLTDTSKLTFKVTATQGTNAVTSTALMRDQITAVSTSGNTINLELASGNSVAYSKVKAFSS
ncbi:MAG: flagellar hook capping FlgD N-terminal domain-containing protein [Burkholderiales bacterium]